MTKTHIGEMMHLQGPPHAYCRRCLRKMLDSSIEQKKIGRGRQSLHQTLIDGGLHILQLGWPLTLPQKGSLVSQSSGQGRPAAEWLLATKKALAGLISSVQKKLVVSVDRLWQKNPATRNRARDHLISAQSTVRCSTN